MFTNLLINLTMLHDNTVALSLSLSLVCNGVPEYDKDPALDRSRAIKQMCY